MSARVEAGTDSTPRPTITGLVLTCNGARIFDRCLASLAFCNQLLVVDSFSTDATAAIAAAHGARFVTHTWQGPLIQFQHALSLVGTEWIVSLDQDEICSDELREAVLTAVREAPSEVCGFYVRRRSWYYDRFLLHSGWYPDRLLRVFRSGGVSFTQSGAHERICPLGATRRLEADILHYPYASFRQHLDKINDYAQQGADDMRRHGRRGGLARGLAHGLGRFARIYLFKRGFLDGRAGFINAAHGAFYAFLKYVRVDEGEWGCSPQKTPDVPNGGCHGGTEVQEGADQAQRRSPGRGEAHGD